MKYKGWLIISIIFGFFWAPLWILSIVITILGIYADKKKGKKPVGKKITESKYTFMEHVEIILRKTFKWIAIIIIIFIVLGYFFGYKPIREYYNEVGILEEKIGDLASEFDFATNSLNYDKAYDIYLDYSDKVSEFSFKLKNPPLIVHVIDKEWYNNAIELINQRIDIQNLMRKQLVSLRILDVVI